jgi:hypothetical protein
VNYVTEHFDKSTNNPINTKTSKFISVIANSTQSDEFNTQELQRCLTTINYVFMIMQRELATIEKCRKTEQGYNMRKYHAYHMLYKPFANSNNNNNNKRRDRR